MISNSHGQKRGRSRRRGTRIWAASEITVLFASAAGVGDGHHGGGSARGATELWRRRPRG
jgi:hypothetical protein